MTTVASETTTGRGGPSAVRRLLGASLAANLADGIGRMAVPLLAMTLTKDPLAISVVGALAFVPWLAFGIPAGVLVDRIDRRVAMALANAVRVLCALAITVAIVADALSLPLLFGAVIVFGLGETIADNATNALVPAVAGRASLDKMNGRIQAIQIGVDHFVAVPLAGLLYSVAIAIPTITATGGYIVAGILALMLPVSVGRAVRLQAVEEPESVKAREGIRFVLDHPFLRPMIIITSLLEGIFRFAQATLLLLIIEVYGVEERWMGFVIAAIGVGGVVGALLATKVVERWGRGRALVVNSALAGVGLIGVSLAPTLGWGIATYSIGAFGLVSWSVPWGSIRQDVTPERLLGRVVGVSRTAAWGFIPIATILGGLTGRIDLRLPFLLGGVLSLVIVFFAARILRSADDQVSAAQPLMAKASVPRA